MEPWSEFDVNELKILCRTGKKINEISQKLRRDREEIVAKIKECGFTIMGAPQKINGVPTIITTLASPPQDVCVDETLILRAENKNNEAMISLMHDEISQLKNMVVKLTSELDELKITKNGQYAGTFIANKRGEIFTIYRASPKEEV